MRRGGLSAILGVLLVCPPSYAGNRALSTLNREQLAKYARDTWKSFEAMTASSVLPADHLEMTRDGWEAAKYTSPTNIASYLWSTIGAESLGLIERNEANRRIDVVLVTLGKMDRSQGFYYNWYDPKTGDRLDTWPGGGRIRLFLSSVDNGWLAASLMMVANTRPELKAAADALLAPMNFGFFYDPYDAGDPANHPGLLRGGYYPRERKYTQFHYGILNTEPRIASYIGIARGDLPADHYFRMTRSDKESSSSIETYQGVPVPEGARSYRGIRVLPSWDGTMFEAMMVPLLVPETVWAAESWGQNHPAYVKAQIEYGLNDAKLGFWGTSAATNPHGGYDAFGVPALASTKSKKPSTTVITPHAAFLAMAFNPDEAMANLSALATAFPVYGEYGFLDAVDVRDGAVSKSILALDQGMIMASIANALADNVMQKAFSLGVVESVIRPLIAVERFAIHDSPIAFEPSVKQEFRRVDALHTTPPAPKATAPAMITDPSGDRKKPRKRR